MSPKPVNPLRTFWILTGLIVSLNPGVMTAADYDWSVLAGRSRQSVDGVGTQAQFHDPSGIAVDALGNIFVSESGSHTIRKIAVNGTVTTFAGMFYAAGSTDLPGNGARFLRPGDVVVDSSGNLFVADTGNNTLRKIDSAGNLTTLAGSAGESSIVDGVGANARFSSLNRLAIGGSATLFAADYNTVRRIDQQGSVETLFTDPGSGQAAGFTVDVAIAPAGEIYFATVRSSSGVFLNRLDPSGMAEILSGGSSLYGFVFDDGEVAFIATGSNHTVESRDQAGNRAVFSGTVTETVLIDGQETDARFFSPESITRDGQGNLYVTSTIEDTVHRIDLTGAISTVAGQSSHGFADGVGLNARMNSPEGVTVDTDGNLWVADTGNHTIRKIDTLGNVTTVAGQPWTAGSSNGQGDEALFDSPSNLVVDSHGNVWVADSGNNAIRRIDTAGNVTTIAGSPVESGVVDGQGDAARFDNPRGIALNGTGGVYVADTYNNLIRNVDAFGNVTTFAGIPGPASQVDGTLDVARFAFPSAIAVHPSGKIYVDGRARSKTVRIIDPSGSVSTVSLDPADLFQPNDFVTGLAFDAFGNLYVTSEDHAVVRVDATGSVLSIGDGVSLDPTLQTEGLRGLLVGVAVDRNRNVYVADKGNNVIRKAAANLPPPAEITSQPVDAATTTGGTVSLSVAAQGADPLTYQWLFNGKVIDGATGSTFELPSAQHFQSGDFSVAVFSNGFSVLSGVAHVSVTQPPVSDSRLSSLSTRALCLTGTGVLIPGFVIKGTESKRMLIRAVGPTLGMDPFFLSGVLPDPKVELTRWNGSTYDIIESNDDWETNANAADIVEVSATRFAFELQSAKESALLVDLPPGQYTVVTSGVSHETGVAIVELYDAGETTDDSFLTSLSNRGFAGIGAEVVIPGFVVSSEGPKTLLLRVAGPTIQNTPYNVTDAMDDPIMTVYRREANGDETRLFSNDDWGDQGNADEIAATAEQVFAFPLDPGSKDAAMLVTLEPGVYTVHGAPADGVSSGVVLVELYVVE